MSHTHTARGGTATKERRGDGGASTVKTDTGRRRRRGGGGDDGREEAMEGRREVLNGNDGTVARRQVGLLKRGAVLNATRAAGECGLLHARTCGPEKLSLHSLREVHRVMRDRQAPMAAVAPASVARHSARVLQGARAATHWR